MQQKKKIPFPPVPPVKLLVFICAMGLFMENEKWLRGRNGKSLLKTETKPSLEECVPRYQQ